MNRPMKRGSYHSNHAVPDRSKTKTQDRVTVLMHSSSRADSENEGKEDQIKTLKSNPNTYNVRQKAQQHLNMFHLSKADNLNAFSNKNNEYSTKHSLLNKKIKLNHSNRGIKRGDKDVHISKFNGSLFSLEPKLNASAYNDYKIK